jgi:hypothetical protein
MSEEISSYLWDGSGEPEAEVARWEATLSRFRYAPRPLRIPAAEPARRRSALRWLVPACAMVAVAALCLIGLSLWRLQWTASAPWRVAAVQGTPRVNGAALGMEGRLGVGDVLETDASSSADVRIARIGTMRVEPGTLLELVSTKSHKHRIALKRGRISAQLWAPPWSLEMQTPSAMAFDLGCKFTLEVGLDGSGMMRVSSGWVELESEGFQTLIPAGAEAETRDGFAPGSPYFEDAPAQFKAALASVNFGPLDAPQRQAALGAVLGEARQKDVMTLFNLMARADREERGRIYDRAAQLDPPPAGVTREAILAYDQQMMNRWWETLRLGNAKTWWIHWEDAFGN